MSDLKESDDHHISRVDEGLHSFGVGQSGKGTVWDGKTPDAQFNIFCAIQSQSLSRQAYFTSPNVKTECR